MSSEKSSSKSSVKSSTKSGETRSSKTEKTKKKKSTSKHLPMTTGKQYKKITEATSVIRQVKTDDDSVVDLSKEKHVIESLDTVEVAKAYLQHVVEGREVLINLVYETHQRIRMFIKLMSKFLAIPETSKDVSRKMYSGENFVSDWVKFCKKISKNDILAPSQDMLKDPSGGTTKGISRVTDTRKRTNREYMRDQSMFIVDNSKDEKNLKRNPIRLTKFKKNFNIVH